MGNDNIGAVHQVDLNKVKNIIGVGSTGAGKSIYLHTVVKKWFRSFTPEQLKLCFVDPKRVEFYEYKGSNYLYHSIVSKTKEFNELIDKLFNLSKKRIASGKIDYHVVVLIDEFADLLCKNETIQSQIASIMKDTDKTGIHFIIMSQRKCYSEELEKAATTKINFYVPAESDALEGINASAAVNLLGSGDELVFNEEIFGPEAKPMRVIRDNGDDHSDPVKFDKIVEDCLKVDYISISFIQRNYYLGFPKASMIFAEMKNRGLISREVTSRGNKVEHVKIQEYLAKKK